ncbi:putative non-specific serine/threonine protein kinase [Helianthus annuus]|nr:putative non-specific serine/threonine protein kinase [Helianthus annuus]KAJ0498599.1 putative non-specific serine/threonine protein kinase [Helianthus annuus]KAJ0664613.1 putative non-specific serine/threonine protein kinase [Helianthus annuus]
MKVGSQLDINDQLVSISGNFTLAFIKHSNKFYVGIWYTDDAEQRKVWVANPKAPFVSRSTVLSIDPNTGNFIFTDADMTQLSITDIQAGPNPNVTATLEDNGNFRLINETNKRVLWQSFDHPTNVLLPGMKLGYNTRTGQNWTLTSWRYNNIPSSGAFTLSWEPINESSQRLMIRQSGEPYWTSGFLDAKTSEFMFLLNKDIQSKYNLTSVYNNEEQYFSYYIDDAGSEDTTDPFPMWILTPNGQITNYSISNPWTPKLCYGYNSSNGCLNPSVPVCRGENDYFSYRSGEFNPQTTRSSTDSNLSISIRDCFVKCWNDCICVGFNSSNTNGTGCVIWTGSNNFSVDGGGDYSTMKYVISSQSPNTGHDLGNKTEKNMKLILTLTIVPLFLGLGLLWFMKKQKQKRKDSKGKENMVDDKIWNEDTTRRRSKDEDDRVAADHHQHHKDLTS